MGAQIAGFYCSTNTHYNKFDLRSKKKSATRAFFLRANRSKRIDTDLNKDCKENILQTYGGNVKITRNAEKSKILFPTSCLSVHPSVVRPCVRRLGKVLKLVFSVFTILNL